MRLGDKVAVVTGGASGIGLATASRFAEEGAAVAVVDVDEAAAEKAAAGIVESGGRAVAVRADVSRAEECDAAVTATIDAFGGLDILVNNAGIERTGSVVAMSETDWDLLWAVNVKSGFLMSKYSVPQMRERGGGVILFTASVGGLWGCTGQVAYSATKAAIVNMTKTMAMDHAAHGIRVNCVCPGGTRTPIVEQTLALMGPEIAEMLDQKMAQLVPYGGRLAEPREMADAFVYLASSEASFVTGHALVVDGAQSAGLFMPEILEP